MAGNNSFDVEKLSIKIMEKLNVQPGQVIWIWASTYSLDLVEALELQIRLRGAFWLLRLIFESLLKKIGQQVPEPYLALVPEHELRLLDDIHAIIEVHDHGGYIPNVDLKRRRLLATEWIALIDKAKIKGIRHIQLTYPTPALAAAYGLALDKLQEAYNIAMNVNYSDLDARQEQLASRLCGRRQVYITSSLGTRLELCIEGRQIFRDTDSLPYGEVYVAPLEDSANGMLVVDKTFLRGRPVQGLKLIFRNGRVIGIEAPDPKDASDFQELLDVSTGDKDIIAELGLGLNPGLTEPVGDIAMDEKIGGSIHIGIGRNQHIGGRNRSNLHKDLVILHPSVWLDGEEQKF